MIRYWKTPGPAGRPDVVLTSILEPPELVGMALARDGNGGAANKAVVGSKRAPAGATHYKDGWRQPWLPVEELSQAHG